METAVRNGVTGIVAECGGPSPAPPATSSSREDRLATVGAHGRWKTKCSTAPPWTARRTPGSRQLKVTEDMDWTSPPRRRRSSEKAAVRRSPLPGRSPTEHPHPGQPADPIQERDMSIPRTRKNGTVDHRREPGRRATGHLVARYRLQRTHHPAGGGKPPALPTPGPVQGVPAGQGGQGKSSSFGPRNTGTSTTSSSSRAPGSKEVVKGTDAQGHPNGSGVAAEPIGTEYPFRRVALAVGARAPELESPAPAWTGSSTCAAPTMHWH